MHYDAYNYIADVKYVVDGKYINLKAQKQIPECILCIHAALRWEKFSFLAHSMGKLTVTVAYELHHSCFCY